MRDYLEELLEPEADALWEADRRLTAALAGSAGEKGASLAVEREEARESAATEKIAAAVSVGRRQGEGAEELFAPDSQTGRWWMEEKSILSVAVEDVLETGRQQLSLLTRTEALERATAGNPAAVAVRAAVSEGGDLTGRSRRDVRRTGGEWTEMSASVGGGATFAGEITDTEETARAERLDRIFRRDSRRYDGGFFLY